MVHLDLLYQATSKILEDFETSAKVRPIFWLKSWNSVSWPVFGRSCDKMLDIFQHVFKKKKKKRYLQSFFGVCKYKYFCPSLLRWMEPSKGKSNSYQNFELVKMKYCSVVCCIKWIIMKYLKCYEMELPKFFLKIYQTYNTKQYVYL